MLKPPPTLLPLRPEDAPAVRFVRSRLGSCLKHAADPARSSQAGRDVHRVIRGLPLSGQLRERRRSLSSRAELLIFVAMVAAAWVVHVVRQVLRERRKPPGSGTTDAYEGNLVVPPAGNRHHGWFGTHGGGLSGDSGHGGGISGHGGHNGGHDGHGGTGGGHH